MQAFLAHGPTFANADAFELNAGTLDDMIAEVDAAGGPQLVPQQPKWRGVSYKPTFRVDQSLDPFSDAYVDQQIALYREISGREIDQQSNEMANFDLPWHINHLNPYGTRDVSALAHHYARLSRMMFIAHLPSEARVLDMGAGWGLSSEFFASMGCRVTAVDISPTFVDLINHRGARLNNGVKAIRGEFETIDLPGKFDAVAFYESLHHAIRPWDAIERAASMLAPEGRICFAAEPVQAIWWKNWGLRLDPVSVYCIRKFGWFESGWSEPFIRKTFMKEGLDAVIVQDPHPLLGTILVARREAQQTWRAEGADLNQFAKGDGWFVDHPYVVSTGSSSIVLPPDIQGDTLSLWLSNFRGRDIPLTVETGDGRVLQRILLPPGNLRVDLDVNLPENIELKLSGEKWSPRIELASPDDREMSFHLHAMELWRDTNRNVGKPTPWRKP